MSQDKKDFTNFDAPQLEQLRSTFQGSVVLPGDKDYDAARLTWDGQSFDQYPALVVYPKNTSDVQSAVAFANVNDLPIAVQGGGHGHPFPADKGLLINFEHMTSIQIDPSSATARIEPGVLYAQLVAEAHKHGLAPLNGFAATVGVVGYALGGGVGWLVRHYGSGAGSIRSAQMVTADGSLIQVDATTYPDLFWGIRGGSGNFGIVTSLECALHPVNEIFAGQVNYPIEQGKQVLTAYLKWIETVPDELTTALRIVHYPGSPDVPQPLRGKSVIVVMACYTGDLTVGEGLLAPMRSLGTVILDTFATVPYSEVGKISGDADKTPPLFFYRDGGALQTLSAASIDALLDVAGKADSGIFMLELRQLGGVLARQPEDAMAFDFHTNLYVNIQAAAPTKDALEHGVQSTVALMQALKNDLTGEKLLNFLDASHVNADLIKAAFTQSTFDRLCSLKRKYDPRNVFRFTFLFPTQ